MGGSKEAEAPAGEPPGCSTASHQAAGLWIRGNTGVRLRRWWRIRKTCRCWLGPNSPVFPAGGEGGPKPHCAGTQSRRDELLLRQSDAALMGRVASRSPLLSFPSHGPSLFPQHPSRCGCTGMTCRLFCKNSFIRSESLQWNVDWRKSENCTSCTIKMMTPTI